MIADLQCERMDEQRAQLPGLVVGSRRPTPAASAANNAAAAPIDAHVSTPTPNTTAKQQPQQHQHTKTTLVGRESSPRHQRPAAAVASQSLRDAPDDAFLEMLIRCQVTAVLFELPTTLSHTHTLKYLRVTHKHTSRMLVTFQSRNRCLIGCSLVRTLYFRSLVHEIRT